MMRNTTLAIILAAGLSGCVPAPGDLTVNDPAKLISPAFLPNCGVPIAGIRADYTDPTKPRRLPRHPDRPIVWAKPLRTESLGKLVRYADCLRIVRPSDAFWHWTKIDTIAFSDDKPVLLDSDEDVVRFLNGNSAFIAESQQDAEHVLLAFAELSGYQIRTEPPEVSQWIDGYEDAQKEADGLDWSISWKKRPEGWEVSCVLVTTHENWSCRRYTILISQFTRIEIKKRERFFYSHLIF
jgi:hypothetical protein